MVVATIWIVILGYVTMQDQDVLQRGLRGVTATLYRNGGKN